MSLRWYRVFFFIAMDTELSLAPADWAEILALLSPLQSGQPLYRLQDVPSLDPYDYGPELCRWRAALEKSQFPIRFDWPQWLEEAKALDRNPELLAEADLLTLRKLMTCYLRTERFTSGTLARIVDNGQLLRILQRLAELSDAHLGS